MLFAFLTRSHGQCYASWSVPVNAAPSNSQEPVLFCQGNILFFAPLSPEQKGMCDFWRGDGASMPKHLCKYRPVALGAVL